MTESVDYTNYGPDFDAGQRGPNSCRPHNGVSDLSAAKTHPEMLFDRMGHQPESCFAP